MFSVLDGMIVRPYNMSKTSDFSEFSFIENSSGNAISHVIWFTGQPISIAA
jgi:hypothetical protein